MKKYFILFLLIFTLAKTFLNAQPLAVEILNTTNGLSNNKVFCFFQDSYGLLWIGTEYGLNVYDGYEFKIFKNDPKNSKSINSNVIWCVAEDDENNLWIGTGEGVSKYIRKENKFKNYDLGTGGSYNSTMFTYVDLKGNVWAAFEGEHVRKYNKFNDAWDKQKTVFDSNKVYLNPSHVLSIVEDKNEKLFVGSLKYGLMWFDEKENIFRQTDFANKDEACDFTIYGNWIHDLYSDSSGVLWITTANGIYKYNPLSKILKPIKEYSTNISDIFTPLNSITADKFGNIWITNSFHGLLKFDGITDNYKRLTVTGQNFSNEGKSDIAFRRILSDMSGVLWIGSFRKGLVKHDPNKKTFKYYFHEEENKKSINESSILSLLESKVFPGMVYVGTRGGGLSLFNTQTNNFFTIPISVLEDEGGGSIRSILEDEDGSLWLGTWGDGLLKMNPQRKIVKRFITDSTNSNSISDNEVRIVRKDSFGKLWLGTYNSGLNYLDVQTNTFNRLRNDDPYPKKLINLIKNKIKKGLDKAKIIKAGNSQNLTAGFKVEKPGNYIIVMGGEGVVSRDSVMWDYGWLEDRNNKILWNSNNIDSSYHNGGALKNRVKIGILQLNSGEYLLNYKSDNSHSFGKWNMTPPVEPEFWGIRIFKIDDQNELDSIQQSLISVKKKLFIKGASIKAMHISKNNIVWVGTPQNGLHKINKTENTVRTYFLDNGKKKPQSDISITDIYENNEGTLWLATNNGLFNFNPANETFTNFTDQDGLPANNILSILPGNTNELWINTQNGISRMGINSNGIPTFINYGIDDGLDKVDFTSLVKLKTINGKYFFGGNNGLIEFDSEISFNTPPKLILSDFKVSNVSISMTDDNSLAKNNILALKNISLSHTQNDLSFEFVALHFSNPKKNKYAHKLEGYEDDWIYDNKRIVTYTNLDPGEYTFKFNGSNSDGVWNETGKSISIIISPPWWLTWWANTIYVFALIFSIYGIRRYELNRIHLKNQLEFEHLASEKLRELDQVKSRFFANISHEFRTPLTLILGQISNTLSNKLDSKIKNNLEVANRNAQRLLHLINQLLDLSKIESGSMNVKSKRADIVLFIKNIFYSFESLAKQREIIYNFNCNYNRFELDYDPIKLEKVFYNLLSNAFKFTPVGGKIEVTIKHIFNSTTLNISDLDSKSGIIEILVADTGTGVSAENIPHLFDRFYQVDNSTTREHQGTGIGLALSKELVELHSGKINVESEVGVGSTFIVQLPFEDCYLVYDKPKKTKPKLSEQTNGFEETKRDLLTVVDKELSLVKTSNIKKNGKEIILVVEDNIDVRNYIVEQLTNDFQIFEAEDGQEGIALAKLHTPDLIITDVMMPKIDGCQLTKELKQDEKTSHIPIVMLTAKAAINNKIEGFEIGADDYILKPFNSEELLVRVKNLIATRRRLRKKFSKATIIKPSDVTAVSMDQLFLQKVLNIVDKYFEDEQFGVDKLAEEANMSVSQLNRKLGALIDQPAGQLIRSMRLQRAADLLKKDSGTIAEICYQVGFNDQTSFTRAFKKQFGDPPSKYRTKLKDKNNDKPLLS